MTSDPSRGWNAVATDFMAARTEAGVAVLRRWAGRSPPGGSVVDLGCGSGEPVTAALVAEGLEVSGVDASPVLVEAFRRRFPALPGLRCSPNEEWGGIDPTTPAPNPRTGS